MKEEMYTAAEVEEKENTWQGLVNYWKDKYRAADAAKDREQETETPVTTIRELEEYLIESVKRGPRSFRAAAVYGIHTAKNRGKPWKQALVCGGAVVAALFSGIVQLYAVAFAVFFLLDPLEVFGRWLALQTRCIALYCVLAVLYMFLWPLSEMTLVAACSAALAVFISKVLNKKWLLGSRWIYSKELASVRLRDAEESERAWQADGKRTCRTLLYEIGYDRVNGDILDLFVKPVYMVAHLQGLTSKYKEPLKEKKALESELEALQRQYEVLDLEYNKLLELIKGDPGADREQEPEENQEMSKEELQHNIKILRAEGLTYRAIADELNCSLWQVQTTLKKAV